MSARPQGALPAFLAELHPDRWTEPFWRAAAERRLVCQRCANCKTFRMPPAAYCWKCQSQDDEWVPLRGKGTVYSYTVVHHAVSPALAEAVPYVVAIVELPDAEDIHLTTNIVGCDPRDVRVGLPVEVAWDAVAEGVVIPRFRPAEG